MQFLEFMNECPALVATDPARKPKYNVLLASCKLMASATGPGDGKSGSAVLCPTNHVLCTSQAPDSRGGLMPANCHTECRKKALPSVQSCRSPPTGAWTDSTIAEFMSVVQGSPKVLIFGIPREPSGNAALKRFYDESVCFHGRKLSPDMESFLNCRFPDDTLLGNNFPLHSWIFIGGRFFGNGYTLVHTPSNELERRLKTVNADRTCGVAGRPPPTTAWRSMPTSWINAHRRCRYDRACTVPSIESTLADQARRTWAQVQCICGLRPVEQLSGVRIPRSQLGQIPAWWSRRLWWTDTVCVLREDLRR
eukprot:COSAG01_NODE_2538_length_7480_cov_167.793930_3_plen_308_part_00